MNSQPKILIVDDDPGIRSQLKWGIEGFDVITADSRPEAIEQFDLHQPPLVTLDLGLPPNAGGTTEGYEILRQILEREPETRVVVVSGSDAQDNADKARESGAFDFFPKPVKLEFLQQIIDRAYEDFTRNKID